MDRVDADRHSRIGRAEVTEGSQTNTNQAVISRRTVIGGAIGGALATVLARPELATAHGRDTKSASLVLLLRGVYQPVVNGPDLGLSTVDLNDGSYSTTKIYPVSGIRDHTNVLEAIGDFYVQFSGSLCAYDIPGGALAMQFTDSNTVTIPDGSGGSYLHGTFELKILEATGRYRSFTGGHNQMVDLLHFLASGDVDEYCFCFITRRHGKADD